MSRGREDTGANLKEMGQFEYQKEWLHWGWNMLIVLKKKCEFSGRSWGDGVRKGFRPQLLLQTHQGYNCTLCTSLWKWREDWQNWHSTARDIKRGHIERGERCKTQWNQAPGIETQKQKEDSRHRGHLWGVRGSSPKADTPGPRDLYQEEVWLWKSA